MATEITRQSVPLQKIIDNFSLEVLYAPPDGMPMITSRDVNRPGLSLSGFYKRFDFSRLQMIGMHEMAYLMELEDTGRKIRIKTFLANHPTALIFSSGLVPMPDFFEAAEKYHVPLLRTNVRTSQFMAMLIDYLGRELAPVITRHGTFVEVYGEGILITGDSGMGKSETAIELVKRGHRLIADDAVELKRISDFSLVGSGPECIRHIIELRGIGLVDVRKLFGIGAVKNEAQVDMVLQLTPWENGQMYERLGMDVQMVELLGVQVPTTTIPVHAGRNLAVIIEVAAVNNRYRKMGYNTAQEVDERLRELARISPEGV